jgi:putative ABC transport system substrate-binding protein
MKRREFVTLLGGAAAFPVAAVAQPNNMPRLGLLMVGNPDPRFFLQELGEGLA